MLPYSDSRFTKIVLTLFFILVAIYAFYESYGLVYGPSMSIGDTPLVMHDPYIELSGKADRIAGLSVNGKDISVTEGGVFDEPYLLAPGNNHIVLEARDRYGNTTSHVIEIAYIPASSSARSLPNAVNATTSSATSSSPALVPHVAPAPLSTSSPHTATSSEASVKIPR